MTGMGVPVTRKNFLAGAFAAGLSPFLPLRAETDEKLLWTAGLMTDTHVGPRRDTTNIRLACRLFNRLGADVVANLGDICDHHWPKGYAAIRKVYDEELVRPHEEIFVMAYHDWHRRQKEPHDLVMNEVLEMLGAKHALNCVMDFRGYPLVVFQQCDADSGKMEKMLADVAAKYSDPAIPIFVFDHEPGFDTTEDSRTWGDAARRRLYAKFPRIVHLSGHTHGAVRSELAVWQGEYTSVNAGCLSGWEGETVGAPPPSKAEFGVLFMEVYRSRLVFRRFDVRDGSECAPAWTIPLPFDPKTAPHALARRTKSTPVAQFPAEGKLVLKTEGNPFSALTLSFPNASDGVYQYRIEIFGEDGVRVARQDVFSSFYLSVKERPSMMTAPISAGFFDPGRSYRLSVTPVNFFGLTGRPLTAGFSSPARSGSLIWESKDPMRECRFLCGLEGESPVPLKDGWYVAGQGAYRLELPRDIWTGKMGDRFRFIVDFETDQLGPSTWTVVLRNPNPRRNANARIATEKGANGRQRFVIEFAQIDAAYHYDLLIREGSGGRIRFFCARLERI